MQFLLSSLRNAQRSMKHKLSWYMATLAAILISAVCLGLFSVGRLSSPKSEIEHTLQTQLDFFQDDMRSLWQNVATSGVHLSSDMTDILENCLKKRGTSFDQLTGDLDTLAAIQDAMLDPLCQYLRQTRCSGAFIILDASMRHDSAPDVRSGLYIQKNNAERATNELLLFRGMPGVSKEHNVMPHRKWQQEFRTALFPGYEACLSSSADSLWDACRITDLITLPGTSERALFLTVPLRASDGTAYGLCGFAVNQTYFCAHFEQPSDFTRLACVLTTHSDSVLDTGAGLVTYTKDGSCTIPEEPLSVYDLDNGISRFSCDGFSFVGKMTPFTFFKNSDTVHTLAVMIPKEDFDHAVLGGMLQTAAFTFLLIFFAAACCIYFALRYLRPVYEDMKLLQAAAPDNAQMSFDDFEPLTTTITDRERKHKALVTTLEEEKQDAQAKAVQLLDENESLHNQFEATQNQLEVAQADAKQLASRRRGELDPDDYEMFLLEYRKFSDKQKLVIDDMVDGLSPQESADHLKYQKSTIYSYRRDIYDRLKIDGKDKLQQLRLRVALLRQEDELISK